MAVLKRMTILMSSMLLILGSIQGCSKSDESKDLSITQAIVNKIKTDTQIPEGMVNVETRDGTAILTGSVDTTEEEKRLISIAESIEGVKSVDSRLMVKETATVKEEIPVPAPQAAPASPPKESTEPSAAAPNDNQAAQPEGQPAQDKMSESSSSSAIAQPPANIEDVSITARVKSLLMADPAYQNVTVETQGGVVTITGTVNSEADADAMVKKVSATEGVKSVDSKVTVESASE